MQKHVKKAIASYGLFSSNEMMLAYDSLLRWCWFCFIVEVYLLNFVFSFVVVTIYWQTQS